MSLVIARNLLENRLNTWASARNPPLQIAWQNVPIRTTSETHLRSFVLPAPTTSTDLASKLRTYSGIYQISIVTPVGISTGQAEQIAAELEALYPVSLRLTEPGSGITLMLVTPLAHAPGIQEGSAYTLPVSTRFRSDVVTA